MKFEELPRKKLGRIFLIISSILFPLASSFYFVSVSSDDLIKPWLSIVLLFVSAVTFVLFFVGFYFLKLTKDQKGKKIKLSVKIAFTIFVIMYSIGGYTVVGLLYFNEGFKTWLVTAAVNSMSHQHYATWFYDKYEIGMVMANNYIVETGEITNTKLVDFKELDFNKVTYANNFEKEIFTKDEGNDLYKIIDINRKGNSSSRVVGKLAVIYDPSKVGIGTSKWMGSDLKTNHGQFVYEITKRYNAIIGINASGFFDPGWNSTGGVPHGYVISDGKLVARNGGNGYTTTLIGFNKENKLVIARGMGADSALRAGIRDGIQWGPSLIVNGKRNYVRGNGGGGAANRSAIGQRADGIVLLLVMDGRSSVTLGADMYDLSQIMWDYGAINAANLDGGTSSSMVLNHEIITNPRNGAYQKKTRPVPNAWIVRK